MESIGMTKQQGEDSEENISIERPSSEYKSPAMRRIERSEKRLRALENSEIREFSYKKSKKRS